MGITSFLGVIMVIDKILIDLLLQNIFSGSLCPVNDRCTNKRFQKSQFSPCEVFRTEKKGLGIRATANISL